MTTVLVNVFIIFLWNCFLMPFKWLLPWIYALDIHTHHPQKWHDLSKVKRLKVCPQINEEFPGRDKVRNSHLNANQLYHYTCYLIQLTFFFNSKTYSVNTPRSGVLMYILTQASYITTDHHMEQTDLKSPGPQCDRLDSAGLLSCSPTCHQAQPHLFCSSNTDLPLILLFSPSPDPPSLNTPMRARNTPWWVSSRKSFYHHHPPHLTPCSTSVMSYTPYLLYGSYCFIIIYLYASPDQEVNSLKTRSVFYSFLLVRKCHTAAAITNKL